ncbi:MAG: T9SS type A sorting domain-containing protein, partial [Fibrobacteres bacterium]|nr:T9SS type A sorting domain-containing protein [Fibrobacterota bacterium]
ATTGEIKWKLEEMSRQSHKQYSPIIYKGIVYGSYVDNDRTKTVYFARNVHDGSVVWEYVLDGYSWGGTAVSPPAPPIDTVNGIIYGSTCKKIGSEMSYPLFGKTFALNLNTGTLIWENNTVYSDYRNYGHLALHKGLLYLITLNYGCDRPDTIGDTIVYSRCEMYSILDAATGTIVRGPGEHDIGGTGTRSIALYDTILITGRVYSHAFWICNLMGKALANTEKAKGYLPDQGDGMSGCGTPVIANGYVFKANGQYELNGQLTAVKIKNVLTMAPTDSMVSWAYRIYGSCAEPVIGDGFLAFANKQGYLNVFANRSRLPGGTKASIANNRNWNKRLSVFPNPFNPVTSLVFSTTSKKHADLKVYNPKGELVKTLLSGPVDVGRHNIAWDATGVVSGVYVAKLTLGGKVSTVKLVVSK